MHQLKLLSLCLLTALAFFATAQEGGNPPGYRPQAYYDRLAEIYAKYDLGLKYLAQERFDDAIRAIREGMALDTEYFRGKRTGHLYLGRVFARLGKTQEAFDEYRRSLHWRHFGPAFHSTNGTIEYGQFLARNGKSREAISLYYNLLWHRSFGEPAYLPSDEPIPYLVLFEPEPGMVAWTYTPDRMVAAFEVLRHDDSGEIPEQMIRVRQLVPDWAYPVVRQAANTPTTEGRRALLDEARPMTKSQEERDWIDQYEASLKVPFRERVRLSAIGMERRRASKVLERARLELFNDVEFRRSFISDLP